MGHQEIAQALRRFSVPQNDQAFEDLLTALAMIERPDASCDPAPASPRSDASEPKAGLACAV